MSYKQVVISKRGGPEVLQVVEKSFHSPANEEVLIKIQACAVGGTDVAMRYWNYPAAPKIPFVPGYEIVGIVEETGSKVTSVKKGDHVAALTVYGGYAEYIYVKQDHLVRVPESLDPAELAVLILNYASAFQMLTRSAKVKAGDHVFITGASGGVGSALLDLGKMMNLNLSGSASVQKHELLKSFGAFPVDYKSQDFVKIIKSHRPEGMDFVFDGAGGENIRKSFAILHRGGMLIEYGFSFKSFRYFTKSVFDLFSGIPKGIKIKGYGISANYKLNKKSVLEDIVTLIILLEKGEIKPVIYDRIPILEAARANMLLESGKVTGNVVLIG